MLKKTETFFWIFVAGILSAAVFIIFIPKGEAILLVNKYHHPTLDIFAKYWTHLGDGLVFIPVLLFLIFYNRTWIIHLAAMGTLQGLSVWLLKKVIFPGTLRPKAFLKDVPGLHYVEGVDVHSFNSFPSGHTATAFGIATFLALTVFNGKPHWQVLLFLVATYVGYTRVYLMQHFFIDIYFGSIVGVITAFAGVYLAEYFIKRKTGNDSF